MTSKGQQGHEAKFYLQDGRCVSVRQDTTKVDGLGGEVWAGAYVLCEFLEQHPELVVKKDVIELGAGCGLCGVVAAALGAQTTVLTDEYPDLLALNIEKNQHLYKERDQPCSRAIATSAALEWGEAASIAPFANKFDLMLGSEITQLGRDLHSVLLETVRSVLRPSASSVALLSMDPCTGSCEANCDIHKCTASHFVHEARAAGFHVTKHPSVQLASRKSVTTAVGALGRSLPIDEDDWSTVFELRLVSDQSS